MILSKVAEWPTLGKDMLIRFTIFDLYISSYCYLIIYHFCFEGKTLVLIVSVLVIAFLLL